MAEYITKEQIIGILYAPRKAILTFDDFVKSIGNLEPVDVIERSKIDKAIKEIEDLDPITERVGLQVKQEILNILIRNIGE